MKKNVFVLDTNVLLSDPQAIYSFECSELIIPLFVIKELDKHKNRTDNVGKNARTIIKTLDNYRCESFLRNGVTLPGDSTLYIKTTTKKTLKHLPPDLNDKASVDVLFIALILELRAQTPDKKYTLITKDINLRIQCDALNINAEDYCTEETKRTFDDLYGGVSRLTVLQDQIDQFYKNGQLELDNISEKHELYSNQFIVMKSGEKSASAIGIYNQTNNSLQKLIDIKSIFGIFPRNKEQNFALNLLINEKTDLVTLVGPAGTGKTLLALAAGCHQVLETNKYEKLIIMKPIQSVGKDIGYLPGSLDEKLLPWTAPIKDNLNYLLKTDTTYVQNKDDNYYLSLLLEKNKIEIEAISYIRGRSIANAYIIVDEAQNLTLHELKTIITRVSENTKIVLTGDLEQIDHPQLGILNSGLTAVIERFKECNLAGHITLIKGERSPLATVASKVL